MSKAAGFTFNPFMLFMVKNHYVLAGCFNLGMLLTLQVSLPRVNRTVEVDRLVRGELPENAPQCETGGANIRGEGDDESVVGSGLGEGRYEGRGVGRIAFGHRLRIV